jgi:amino acid adenylation domain-containing protein
MSAAYQLVQREPLVHERFEAHANADPEAVALRFGGKELSYGELNTRANRLARYLYARGLGPEDRVVVCVEPSFDIVVALLALLKLGSVYVPLDPSYPEARIEAILQDTQPRFVLTQAAIHERLAFAGTQVLELDQAEAELRGQPSRDLGSFSAAEQTAYIYYTSGTTGVPKGVVATHANLASYIGSAAERYRFTRSDVGLALARFSFSISMFELLSPLVAGGSLIILERAHILDFPRLAEALSQATFFHAGPSLLRGLLAYLERNPGDAGRFRRIRHASSGGDMVPVEVLERMLRIFDQAEVFVIYGCSEISCMGTTYEAPRGEALVRSYVGRPFAGTRVRVVDDELRDVAEGEVGEVWFAGPGVVSGYLNRPELTAEKFVLHEGLRFYRTGDRGRLNAQGLLELVGRADFQIKIGGIRVELGEIEHHLRRAPGVANGVVSAKTLAGETALVAYVVVEEGDQRSSASRAQGIREYLVQQLPDYMVPALFVELPALPLNHNAKLDRRALPDPPAMSARPPAAERFESPTEQQLAAIWREILSIDGVARDDNFFERGGTSLRALQLLQEVERRMGVTLTGLEILREPLSILALLCDRRAGSSRPLAAPSGTDQSLEPFFFGDESALYGALHGAAGAASRTAVLVCGPLGHERLRAHFVLQQLARRLAKRGIACLRFDYFGCGDSLGEPEQATLAHWQRDIATAHRELQQRTGAERILGVGARLGATLLAAVADDLRFDRLVLWDPVRRGAEYRRQLTEAERRYARANPFTAWRSWLAGEGREQELLGAAYSDVALEELSRLELTRPASCKTETFDSQSGWLDLAELEDMLPDVGISARLSQLLEAS